MNRLVILDFIRPPRRLLGRAVERFGFIGVIVFLPGRIALTCGIFLG